jgi:GNAT superfamily N-acetyltransferase
VGVHVIDPRDDEAFAAWYAVVDAARRDLGPDEPGWLPEELRARAGDQTLRAELLAAVDATGRVIGAARAEFPLLDNLHLALGEVAVHPEHRRRGVGRALLAAVEARAVADGRTVCLVQQDEPAGLEGRSPGRAFAGAVGYDLAQRELRRDLAIPADSDRLAELAAAYAPRARGYRLVTWLDRCPDSYVDDRAYLGGRMSTDIPLGDMVVEEEQWDAARVRRREDVAAASDRVMVAAGAVDERTGRLVAYTEIQFPRRAPEQAYQDETIVVPEHRGHRLGALVKIANLRQLEAVSPRTSRVVTWNAEDNKHMIAVNEALGCTVNGASLEWQKHLSHRPPPSR